MNFRQYVKGDALEISWSTIKVIELVSFLRNNTYITKLILKIAQIDAEGAKELAKLTHLTSLNLESNHIGNKGTEALADGNLACLALLDLSLNKIGDKGVEALANGRFTSLDLRWNRINDKSVEVTSLEKGHDKEMEESSSSFG